MQKGNKDIKKVVSRHRGVDLGATRKESLGEWLYTHRVGLIVVFVTFIFGGTWLATARYSFTLPPVEYLIEFVEEVPSEAEVEEFMR